MIPLVRQDIIKVLRDAEVCVSKSDASCLREISDHTIHNSSIFQDEDSISVAVITYSLSKMCERGGVDVRMVSSLLKHAQKHLEKEELKQYRHVIKRITALIARSDSKFRLYIQAVFDQAQIKKGSRLYYHGISLAQAAGLLGVSQWELMGYVGKTQIIDRYKFTGSVKDVRGRLSFARQLFMKS